MFIFIRDQELWSRELRLTSLGALLGDSNPKIIENNPTIDDPNQNSFWHSLEDAIEKWSSLVCSPNRWAHPRPTLAHSLPSRVGHHCWCPHPPVSSAASSSCFTSSADASSSARASSSWASSYGGALGVAAVADELLLHRERERERERERREQRRVSPTTAVGGPSPRMDPPLLRRSPWSPPWARPRPDLDGLKKRAATEDSMWWCGWAMEDSMRRTQFYVVGMERRLEPGLWPSVPFSLCTTEKVE
jgi:hypothetical protein